MTSQILKRFKQKIQELKLIPSGGGCFEIKLDDQLIYSKLKLGKFPNEPDILKVIENHLKS
ncbi:Rdx family protein [Telmatocola sphagniphila]|uniref:Rdx family protein n=1 Tax=Telmatocola sphagniphila TaxID=1123043 RepID=A0A8E6ETD9_9BACT|nr:Rdx family protein [Telmatocola sphagniphila]